MKHSRSQTVAEAVEQLAGPVLLRMIHTQQGAYAGCCVFRHGTAKDRKKAVKAMKGAPPIAIEDWRARYTCHTSCSAHCSSSCMS